MKPDFKIIADGKNISDLIKDNLSEITLTDKRNLEADQLDIKLTDPEGKIALPRKGVELQLYLGFEGSSLFDKGTYEVDEVEESGPPDMITIRARSAYFRGDLKEEIDKDWDNATVDTIIRTLAEKHGLRPAIEDSLGSTHIDHLDQTNESDANLITRLAKKYDALATIKNRHLIFVPAGYSKTVSGIQLPTKSIHRNEGDRHSFNNADRKSRYTGVKAKWQDTDAAETKTELVGESGYVKTLRPLYPFQSEAQDAAKAKWQEMQRNTAEMSLTLSVGQPDIIPNMPVRLTGWRSEINAINWTSKELSHTLNASGLTTSLQLEQA